MKPGLEDRLSGVESINYLCLSVFWSNVENRITKIFKPIVWQNVEILEIDEPLCRAAIKAIGDLLKNNQQLTTLILPGKFLPDLPLLSSLTFIDLGFPSQEFPQLYTFLKDNYPDVQMTSNWCQNFRPIDFNSWGEIPPITSFEQRETSISRLLTLSKITTKQALQKVTITADSRWYQQSMDLVFAKQREGYCFSTFFSKDTRRTELTNIRVAILDTGVDYFHPDLTGTIAGGASFVPYENWWTDGDGHGTHCAGIIAGTRSGLAPGVQLYIGKVCDSQGGTDNNWNWIASGIQWAIDNKVDVISMSLGDNKYHHNVCQKTQEAISKGIIVVCAAGNDGSIYQFGVNFPATIGGVIRVGSVNEHGRSSQFSSVGGPEIDAVAPGEDILSTSPCVNGQSRYCNMSGTSMATPFIASVCALLLAYDRDRNPPHNNKLLNGHCIKDLLGKLSFNNTQDVAKGRGAVSLKEILEVPQSFDYKLSNIC